MPKLPFSVITLVALALSVAQAQTAGGPVGAGTYQVDGSSATVGQTITLGIPTRFGLHLHRSSWTLDLGLVGVNGNYGTTRPIGVDNNTEAKCVRAGDHSSGTTGTGRDFLYYTGSATNASSKNDKILSLVNGAAYEGDQYADNTVGNPYSYTGTLTWPAPLNPRTGPGTGVAGAGGTIASPIGGYPGFYTNNGVLVWKGPIMCSFQTIVQKFSNSANGFIFTAALTPGDGSTFPLPLYVRDFIKSDEATNPLPDNVGYNPNAVVLTENGEPELLAAGFGFNGEGFTGGTTGGWLDDHLLQVLVFDGSETDGSYKGTVTYTLADLSFFFGKR